MLDAESAWDGAAGKPAAVKLVDKILGAVPDAVGRVADCAWWAPRFVPGGGASHPGFPTAEFGRLCATRYPQCYALRPAHALAWARSPAQYPSYGSPAATVFPTVRGYERQTPEVCALALAEPHALYWLGSHGNAMAPEVALGLRAAAKIRALGHAAVADFQRAAGLTPDGICGARTCAALGL
jgi:hypothetical protein